jgi:hypothetical protein
MTNTVSRAAIVVAALVSTVVGAVLFASSASAVIPASGGASPIGSSQLRPVVVHTLVTAGMSGWQVALIAAGAALLAAVAVSLTGRARARRAMRVLAA